MLLPVHAQPAQKVIRGTPALGRDAVAVAFEQPVDKDGELVESERYLATTRQRREYLMALVPPVAGLEIGAELGFEVNPPSVNADLGVRQLDVCEQLPDPPPCA